MTIEEIERVDRLREHGLVESDGLRRSSGPPSLDPLEGDRSIILIGMLLMAASGAIMGLGLGLAALGLTFDSVRFRSRNLEMDLGEEVPGKDIPVIQVATAVEPVLEQLIEDAIAVVKPFSERAAEELRAELL